MPTLLVAFAVLLVIAGFETEAVVQDYLESVRNAPALAALQDVPNWEPNVDRLLALRGTSTEQSFRAFLEGFDVAAILAHTDRVIFLHEGDVADIRPDGVMITDVQGQPLEREVTIIDWTPEAACIEREIHALHQFIESDRRTNSFLGTHKQSTTACGAGPAPGPDWPHW